MESNTPMPDMPEHSGPWRLLVADDKDIVRTGIKSYLGSYDGEFEIVGEASNGEEAVEMTKNLLPDLVVMDIRMPQLDGIGATSQIKEVSPRIPVMILTGNGDIEYFFSAMKAGAAQYVLKDADGDEMVATIRSVLAGENTFPPETANRFLADLRKEREDAISMNTPPRWVAQTWQRGPDLKAVLTDRERQVLIGISHGWTNPTIAERLHISPSTVKNHIEQIFRKLEVSDRTQACLIGVGLGYLDLEMEENGIQKATVESSFRG